MELDLCGGFAVVFENCYEMVWLHCNRRLYRIEVFPEILELIETQILKMIVYGFLFFPNNQI